MTVSISRNVYNSRRMDEEREVGTGSEPNQGGSESEPSQIRIGCGMRLRLVSGHQMKKTQEKNIQHATGSHTNATLITRLRIFVIPRNLLT